MTLNGLNAEIELEDSTSIQQNKDARAPKILL
jgi:hypothetical protein